MTTERTPRARLVRALARALRQGPCPTSDSIAHVSARADLNQMFAECGWPTEDEMSAGQWRRLVADVVREWYQS
jgi:hypothetical protein